MIEESYIENKTISKDSFIFTKIVLSSLSNLFSDRIELEYCACEYIRISPKIFFQLIFLTLENIEAVRNKESRLDMESIEELFFERQTYLKKGEKIKIIIERTACFDGVLFNVYFSDIGQIYRLKLQTLDKNCNYKTAVKNTKILEELLESEFFRKNYPDNSINMKGIQTNNIIMKEGFMLDFILKNPHLGKCTASVFCHNEEILSVSKISVDPNYEFSLFEQALSSLRDMTLFYIQG